MENSLDKKMKRCPHCAETVRIEAQNCSYCGRDIDTTRLKGSKRPAYVGLGLAMLTIGLLTTGYKFGTVLILLGLCLIVFGLFSGNI